MLSAIHRTGQNFGALHVIAVLRGVANDMAIRHGHDRLSVFGIGKDQSERFWRGVLRQLIAAGAVRTGDGEYPTLSLVSEQARPILRGEIALRLREESTQRRPPRARAGEAVASTASPEDAGLFETLRAWRSATAREESLPPYLIFHDSSLRDIAAQHPKDKAHRFVA